MKKKYYNFIKIKKEYLIYLNLIYKSTISNDVNIKMNMYYTLNLK